MRNLSLLAFCVCASAYGQQFIGPGSDPYLEFADSPWASVTFDYFHLETLEDNLFNAPGATLSSGIVTSSQFGLGSIVDSVDEDDGSINGTNGFNGGFGDSLFSGGGLIQIDFSAGVLGALPNHVGLVWTDGTGGITFEAFDENGASLGTSTGNHADGGFNGSTAEDRFYGVVYNGGISRITISNGGGIEADHLQYGFAPVPEPATLAVLGFGALAAMRRKKRA